MLDVFCIFDKYLVFAERSS